METEIIKTDDPNIVIERKIIETEIDIEAINSRILESTKLANDFDFKKKELEKILTESDSEVVREILQEKIEEYQKLVDGFLLDKSKAELYLNNIIN